jgi:hypothetical protein
MKVFLICEVEENNTIFVKELDLLCTKSGVVLSIKDFYPNEVEEKIEEVERL